MINPHQNININISYNLAAERSSKAVPGKKVNKNAKLSTLHSPQCDIDIKLKKEPNKNVENNLRKANESKKSENKKSKKKNVPPRNVITPDMFNERRAKTEAALLTETDHPFSSFKKQKKTHPHFKSANVGQSKVGMSIKGKSKGSKNRSTAFASCMLYNKKYGSQLGEHLVSQVIPSIKKKRTQSAHLVKDDKIVSKLLNISLLASELGGSQIVTSERKSGDKTPHRALKEYMSSIDLRIIKNMATDVPYCRQNAFLHEDVIKSILKQKKISLEEFTKKVILIQRQWRKLQSKNIVTIYAGMFRRAAAQRFNANDFSQLSDVPLSESSRQDFDIFTNQNLLSGIKKSGDNSECKQEWNQQNLRWIEQSQSLKQGEGLNFSKYRELMIQSINKKNEGKVKGLGRFKQQQIQQWNNINKKIASSLNEGAIDSKSLLDQLIKQSNFNKKWIQDDFQQVDPSLNPKSDEASSGINIEIGEEEQFLNERNQGLRIKQIAHHGSEDSLDEQEQYDRNKYLAKQRNAQIAEIKQQKLDKQEIDIQLDKKVEKKEDKPNHESEGIDQLWISQQIISENDVVKKYLDCGLEGFGLNFTNKIIQLKLQDQKNEIDNLYSSDEAIGAKFEKGSSILPQEIQSDSGEKIMQWIISFLIAQFASDISVILKKTTQVTQQQKRHVPPSNRYQGIPTNFNSIKEYINKFLNYILKSQQAIIKITDNINKDIGPSSLQILTYLRPEPEDSIDQTGSGLTGISMQEQQDDNEFQDEQGLFVIPAEMFQQYEAYLQDQYRQTNTKQMNPRTKAYLNFWHRCIFESFNECLDYERPFGIEGKPYEWVTNTRVFRKVSKNQLIIRLHGAEDRLLQLTALVGGIIFDKADSPFSGAELNEQTRQMMNEQRLSRMLATELLETQQSWINYNDQMAELLVQLSRMIEDKLFFEYSSELKRLQRRRKILVEESRMDEPVSFSLQQL